MIEKQSKKGKSKIIRHKIENTEDFIAKWVRTYHLVLKIGLFVLMHFGVDFIFDQIELRLSAPDPWSTIREPPLFIIHSLRTCLSCNSLDIGPVHLRAWGLTTTNVSSTVWVWRLWGGRLWFCGILLNIATLGPLFLGVPVFSGHIFTIGRKY